MDYVIAGLGLGAVLAIAGFMMRELAVSRPAKAPAWISDTGVSLMLAAVIIWALTTASLFSGLDDTTSARVVAGGSIFAVAVSLIAAWVATRAHRPRSSGAVVSIAVATSAPATDTVTANSDVEAITESASLEGATGVQPVASELAPDIVPPPVDREPKDWEEIWRQTWGSGASAKAALTDSKPDDAKPAAEPDEAVRETWSSDCESASALPASAESLEAGKAGDVDIGESPRDGNWPDSGETDVEQGTKESEDAKLAELGPADPEIEIKPTNGQFALDESTEEQSEDDVQAAVEEGPVVAEADHARQSG